MKAAPDLGLAPDPPGLYGADGGRPKRWARFWKRRLIVPALIAQFLWLCGCRRRESDAVFYGKAAYALRSGDFNASLEMAREGLRQWPVGEWGWKFRLLCIEDLVPLGRMPEARALLEAAHGLPSASLRGRWALDRARIAKQSDPKNVPALLQEALQQALAAGDIASSCRAWLLLAELAETFSEAEKYNRAALAQAEREPDPYFVIASRLDLGYNRARFGRFDEAIPFLEDARDRALRRGAKYMIATALGNLGWCFSMLGDTDRAQGALTSAAEITERIGAKDNQQRWLGGLGNIYMIRGDLDRAESYQQRAAQLARDAENDAWLAIALTNLAQIALDRGNLAAAESYNNQALEIKRRLGNQWSLVYSELTGAAIERLGRHYQAAETEYRTVIQHAPRAHAPDVLWQAYGGLAYLYWTTGRPVLAEAQYRNAIDTIDHEWDKLTSDDWKTTFLAPAVLIGFFQDYVDFLIAQGHPARALEVAESSRARVLNQRLGHRGWVPPSFQLNELLAAAQASHTVILSYWLSGPGGARSSLWVIGSGRLTRFDLPPGKEIARLVEKYTGIIAQGGDPLARRDGVSSALYAAVLAPVQKLIAPGSNVIIVPDGALHQLNFETLVVPGAPPHYWIEDVAISTAPCLRALTGGQRQAARTPKLLLLGDPVLTGQDFAPLTHVKQEIAAVAEQFPAADRVVITGANAIPAQYAKASPANFTDIHFATHATANRESPLNSAIILSHQGETYKLYARDVADVPLSADLVTISACSSAGAKAYAGEGLMGFAWAFLQAGAQNVIASLWDVDDARSAAMMGGLYARITAGQSPARALRACKLALLHGGGGGRLPYYWGPLQVFTRRIERPTSVRLPATT